MKLSILFFTSLFSCAMEREEIKTDICGICLETTKKELNQSKVCSFKSQHGKKGYHTFCTQCISRCIARGYTQCPTCRKPFKIGNMWEINSKDFLLNKPKEERYSYANDKEILTTGKKLLNKMEKKNNMLDKKVLDLLEICKAKDEREKFLMKVMKGLVRDKEREKYIINPRDFVFGGFAIIALYWAYTWDHSLFGEIWG